MQSNCIFPGRYAPLTYYDCPRNTLMARNAREITLHTCISITDKAKINEQNKSIAIGPFYMGTYFEPIWTLLPEDVAVLNPTGYRTLKRRYPACVRHQKWIFTYSNGVVCCVKNRNPIA